MFRFRLLLLIIAAYFSLGSSLPPLARAALIPLPARAASASAPPATVHAPNEQTTSTWVFQRVRRVIATGDDRLPRVLVQVASESVDVRGGDVDLSVDGAAFDLCPRGSERFHFHWRFGGDISRVRPGDTVQAAFEATTGPSGACRGQLALRTLWALTGSRGTTGPDYFAAEGRRVDGDRFYTGSSRLSFPEGRTTASGTQLVHVERNEPYPDRPEAYFLLRISTSGGYVEYVYEYAVTGGVDGSSATAGGARALGGLDLAAYCRANGAEVVLDGGRWYCVVQMEVGGMPVSVDAWTIGLTDACRWQYRNDAAYAEQRTPDSPQSWVCYVRDGGR